MSSKLRRRVRWVTWRCPQCGYTTSQPRKIVASMHRCWGDRLVHLVRQDNDD